MALSLRSARSEFETVQSIINSVADDGELTLTAGQMARQNLPDKATYEALAKALGEDATLFRFRSVPDRATPKGSSLSVFASGLNGDAEPKVYTPDLVEVPCTFVQSRVGPGGFSIVKIGTATVEIDIPTSRELVDEIRAADEDDEFHFSELPGAPDLTFLTDSTEVVVPTLRPVPQREIPPHSEDVPMNTSLKVIEILEPSRAYGEPRLRVKAKDPQGKEIVGLIATSPIRRAIGVRTDKGFEITPEVVGESFEIVEVVEMKDRTGKPIPVLDHQKKPVLNDKGKPRYQRSVVVRRTTGGGIDLDLSL